MRARLAGKGRGGPGGGSFNDPPNCGAQGNQQIYF